MSSSSAINCLLCLICAIFVATALGTALLPPAQPRESPETDFCTAAYDTCVFKFSGQDTIPTYDIGGPANEAFTDPIVLRPFTQVGALDTSAIVPEFLSDDGAIDITEFGEPRFSETHFKAVTIAGSEASGIAHEELIGEQLSLGQSRCVRLFISSYEMNNKQTTRSSSEKGDNCIVFRTS